MTIEVNGRLGRVLFIVAALILASALIIGLALLGRGYTSDGKVLSWTDWRVLQARTEYRDELGGLQRDAGTLVDILNADVPDPVRGQIVADQVAQRWATGNAALAVPRAQLIAAANAVRDWVTGAAPRNTAQAAIEELLAQLQNAARAVAEPSSAKNSTVPSSEQAPNGALPRVGDHLPDATSIPSSTVTTPALIATPAVEPTKNLK